MKHKTHAILISGLWISLNLIWVVNGTMRSNLFLQITSFVMPCFLFIMASSLSDYLSEAIDNIIKLLEKTKWKN